MNTGLLTNTFIDNVTVNMIPSKPIADHDNTQHANTLKPTTDNTLNIAQNEPIDRPPQEFRHTLSEKTTTEGQQNGENPTSDKAEQPGVVQTWLAQYPLVEHGKKGIARKMGTKAGYELAQLLADLSTGKFPHGTGPTAKPVAKTPLTTTDKGWLGLKAVLPDNSGAAECKIAGKIQISSKTLINTKGLINQQNGRELDSEALTNDGKTTPAGEKPAIAGTSVASGSQKTTVLGGQKLTHETTNAGSKTAVAGGKTAITGEQAIPGGQKATVDPEKSALIAEKSVQRKSRSPASVESKDVFNSQAAKADTTRRSHPGTPGFSELTNGSGKEQPDNPSARLLLQNLNPAQVQIATGQTKENRSSTSGRSSNSSFEQLLSNNAQVPIAEHTPASVQNAKAANSASTPNTFASVSEQLQESIHSSLSQGDQQLTIRLNPPELGRVFIKFQGKGDQITGLLEVDRAQTRYEIEQALPQIIRNLAECGVQIKRLEVVLTNQQEQHAFKDTSLEAQQDGWAGQQAGPERNNPDHDNFGTNEWLTDETGYSGFSEPQEMLIADGFVDVLV